MKFKHKLKKVWISIELFGIKEGEGTYIHEPYKSLPPIEIPDRNLDWLNLSEFKVGINEERENNTLEKEERQELQELWVYIQQQVDWLNLSLPKNIHIG